MVPLFHDQIRAGGPVTITTTEMTRFLLNLNDAVDTILAAADEGLPGEIYIPRAPAALMTDIATALIGDRDIDIDVIGVRPGEKIHESLISEEEATRTVERGAYYAIRPMLTEVDQTDGAPAALDGEFSSDRFLLDAAGTAALLRDNQLLIEQASEARPRRRTAALRPHGPAGINSGGTMKILVLGATGMMGHMACRVLGDHHEVIGTTRRELAPGHALDQFLPAAQRVSGVTSRDLDTVRTVVDQHRPRRRDQLHRHRQATARGPRRHLEHRVQLAVPPPARRDRERRRRPTHPPQHRLRVLGQGRQLHP